MSPSASVQFFCVARVHKRIKAFYFSGLPTSAYNHGFVVYSGLASKKVEQRRSKGQCSGIWGTQWKMQHRRHEHFNFQGPRPVRFPSNVAKPLPPISAVFCGLPQCYLSRDELGVPPSPPFAYASPPPLLRSPPPYLLDMRWSAALVLPFLPLSVLAGKFSRSGLAVSPRSPCYPGAYQQHQVHYGRLLPRRILLKVRQILIRAAIFIYTLLPATGTSSRMPIPLTAMSTINRKRKLLRRVLHLYKQTVPRS